MTYVRYSLVVVALGFGLVAGPVIATSQAANFTPTQVAQRIDPKGGKTGEEQKKNSVTSANDGNCPMNKGTLIDLPDFRDADCQTADEIVGLLRNLVNVALMFVLSVALIFLIISGYQFVMAGGNTEAMTRAKTSLLYITIGILTVLSAFMIVKFVGSKFIDASKYELGQ